MDDQNISTEQNLERRLNELESIVGLLEDGTISINEAIAKYSEGMKLALDCRRDLNLLERKVAEARQEAMDAFTRLAQEQKQEQEEWMNRTQQKQASANAPMPNNAPFAPSAPAFGQANMPNMGQGQSPIGHAQPPMGQGQMGRGFGQPPMPMNPNMPPHGPMGFQPNGQLMHGQQGAMPNQNQQGNAGAPKQSENNGFNNNVPSGSDVPF